jgi:hypothetical protein
MTFESKLEKDLNIMDDIYFETRLSFLRFQKPGVCCTFLLTTKHLKNFRELLCIRLANVKTVLLEEPGQSVRSEM